MVSGHAMLVPESLLAIRVEQENDTNDYTSLQKKK